MSRRPGPDARAFQLIWMGHQQPQGPKNLRAQSDGGNAMIGAMRTNDVSRRSRYVVFFFFRLALVHPPLRYRSEASSVARIRYRLATGLNRKRFQNVDETAAHGATRTSASWRNWCCDGVCVFHLASLKVLDNELT